MKQAAQTTNSGSTSPGACVTSLASVRNKEIAGLNAGLVKLTINPDLKKKIEALKSGNGSVDHRSSTVLALTSPVNANR